MKKFTKNFLLGEYRLGNVLRKIGLSMVAILMAVTVFGQVPNDDAQDTYYVKAQDVSDCYRLDNDYAVQISMRDFVEIDLFRLVLTYDDALFTYESVSIDEAQLTGLTVTNVVQTEEDKLVMVWDSGDDPQTIVPDNDTTDVFVLHFSLNGFHHVDGNLTHYETDLIWLDESSVWNEAQTSEILTWFVEDGGIDVNQSWPDVVVDVTTANCDGGSAVATVITPANEVGMMYSFNADDDFHAENFTGLTAPSTGHTVIVKNGECVSFVETFDVDAQPAFSYTVQDTVYVNCPGGDGDVEFEPVGGSSPYAYYIIPESDTAQVIYDLTMTGKSREAAIVYLDDEGYNTGNRINQLSPGYYWVAVQDANHCADLTVMDWWTGVDVLDTLTDWIAVETEHVDELCADFDNGSFSLYVTGATPFVDGYIVLVDGVLQANTDSLVLDALEPGDYDVIFRDSMACQWDTTITIVEADPIVFEVGQTDASCELDNGMIWIETATITGGSGVYDFWVYDTLPDFSTADTIWAAADTAKLLAPNVYYVQLYDDAGCFDRYENINGDDAIKILSIDFTIDYAPILCNGGTTDATVTVVNPANHGFKFNIDGGTWTTDNVFEDLVADSYTFGVWDTTLDCTNTWTKVITEPTEVVVSVIDLLTLEPSCHGSTDGNIQVRGTGGNPFVNAGGDNYYEYKFDERPWEDGGVNNTFAADTGFHTIVIRDANGCLDTTTITLSLTPNIIDVDDADLDCYGDVTTLSGDTISWIHEPVGLAQGEREPKFYYAETYSVPADIVAGTPFYVDSTELGVGVYYFIAQDEWGCLSNVDTVTITEPEPIVATANAVRPASCYGITDGQIIIEAWKGLTRVNPHLPDTVLGRYQYTITQSSMILNQTDWYDQVNWSNFQNDDAANDSVVVVDVQKGTYYVAVRDFCGLHGRTELIQGPFEVFVDGADALEINSSLLDINNVTCNVYGEDPSDDGSILGLLAATSGGWGGYLFTIDGANLPIDYVQESTSGDYMDLPAGLYTITVEDDSLGCILTEDFEITQPDAFGLMTEILHVSCNGAHDGVIRYMIDGGTAPYMETTNNVGIYEDPATIPAERWYMVDTSSNMFDRRVEAGIYEIYVKDVNGCIFGAVIDTILEPEALVLEVVKEVMPDCAIDGGTADNGEIWVVPTGGWNSATDGYEYIVSLGTTSILVPFGDTAKFIGLTASSLTIQVLEANSGLVGNPLITYSDYYANWTAGVYTGDLPWQNSDTLCVAEVVVDLQGPDPIDYTTIAFYDEVCYNTFTGEIHLGGITGGTKPYTVWVEGPDVYRPLNSGIGEKILLVDGTVNLTEYIWDDLIRGHYTVFITDANDCQLVRESGEIERPDSLMITNTELLENAMCNGGTGLIKIHATGGVGPYTYAVDSALVPADGTHPFPIADTAWVDTDTFEVTAATWISYVKDANGCVVGWATDENGTPILQHRVTVTEPDPVVAEGFSQVDALCYGDPSGQIWIDTIYGGNGGDWRVVVSGTDYAGNPVDTTYMGIDDDADIKLLGLMASTIETDPDSMITDDWYTILVYDNKGCVSVKYYQYVLQPEEFVIVVKTEQDAFICPDDLAGIFEMQVVSGGTPFGYNGADPIFNFKWEAYSDSARTDMVDSADWGFTKTFLGKAGLYYTVHAEDANGCETEADTFLVAPTPIVFMVEDLTCFGDTLASARVSATGTEGRSFRVRYKEIVDEFVDASWTILTPWFTGYIDVMDEFHFDNENIVDIHYLIAVEDTLGCLSTIDTITFDGVQHVLALEAVVLGELGECTSDVEITAQGGIPPYVVTIDGTVLDGFVTEMVVSLTAGVHDIVLTDSHLICEDNVSLDIAAVPVVRDVTVETFIGHEVAFSDVEAGIVDDMLAAGDHTFTYNFGDDSCERTLNVTVVAVPRPLTIIEVQGQVDASPWLDAVVEVTGTVTGVSAGEGFFMQDANAAWSGVWVAFTETNGILEGNGVVVVGTVAEVASVTTINATEVGLITPPLTVVAVVLANPAEAEDEMYESVLVQAVGARATAADAGNGEWTIFTDAGVDAVVNDWLFSYDPTEGNFYDVTGIVNARLDAFKLEPRKTEDVVDLTITSVDPTLVNVQFKVYPNPFNDRVYIDNNDKLTRVVISNIAGQRVIDVEYPGREIRTANLVSGVYVVSMFTENGIAKTERIVKR